ncbi:MAG: PSD1 domain-containing protein [Verrucomicrobia subdivision 3 bacterium]|nr:PSD1 domain-containing protein [Limisphaerales bacterium]
MLSVGGWRLGIFLVSSLSLFAPSVAHAAELTPAQTQFFENKIRPLLAENCYPCHSPQADKVKGGLRLDTRDGLLKGGVTGPALVPGDLEKSLLIMAVRYSDPDLQMPPKDKKLSAAQIADLEAWVKMGAPDPRIAPAAQPAWKESSKAHWAWQPLTQPSGPEVKDAGWAKTPVDNFILAKLEEKNLKPNPPADKRTLIRRATFDLIGLPPTTEEVAAFLDDESPTAFANVVDRLLASPHYGERWGRHWLDVARYSDTKGQIKRQREDPNYPYAWTYRDYVIRSLNEDKPYNIFIIEQLAADKLPATKRNPTNLTALGFLTVGDRFMGMPNDIINDRIDVVTKGFLGLTVSCARCHDHKFDPIPTQDYYSLHGIFASTTEPSVETVVQKIENTPAYLDYYKQRNQLEAQKEKLETDFRESRRNRDREKLREVQRAIRQNAGAVAQLEMSHPGAPMRAMRVQDSTRPHDSPVFLRGEAQNRGAVVPRRFLEILSPPNRPALTNGSGRLELAHAIANPSNPLTPRVLINRLWQHHFGAGFVTTPDDFGTMAEPPSHPELLDYLAARFIAEGWSLKKMHRLIMLSSVYQQSSASNPRYAQVDPGNRLLWRANIQRLEFEALRDSLLAIGGSLDERLYGRPVNLERNADSLRRTIYGTVDRSDVLDVLLNFDFANPDMPSGKRYETFVPQQALFLMNSPVVVEQAKRLVSLKTFADCADDAARIQFLYERIYQRPARADELRLGLDFIAQAPITERPVTEAAPSPLSERPRRVGPKQLQRFQKKQPAETKPRTPLTGWQEYAHALLQANEASFVN